MNTNATNPIKAIIIDDEPLARSIVQEYLQNISEITVLQECSDGFDGIKAIQQLHPDLIFLDIQMPKMNGLDFLKAVQNPPIVVITTAYPTYALDGFQLNVLDYLLKPITFDRFFKSVKKASDYYHLINKPAGPAAAKTDAAADYFFIRCGSKYEKIHFDQILYVEGMQNYITIYTQKGKFVTLLYLKNLEENLDPRSFIRVHKSYIVSIGKIEGIEGNEIFIQTHRIPISRNYRDQVLEQVVTSSLLHRPIERRR